MSRRSMEVSDCESTEVHSPYCAAHLVCPMMIDTTPKPAFLKVVADLGETIEFWIEPCQADYAICFECSFEKGVAWLDRQTYGFVIVSPGAVTVHGQVVLRHAEEKHHHLPALMPIRPSDMDAEGRYLDYMEKPVSVEHIRRLVAAQAGSHPDLGSLLPADYHK